MIDPVFAKSLQKTSELAMWRVLSLIVIPGTDRPECVDCSMRVSHPKDLTFRPERALLTALDKRAFLPLAHSAAVRNGLSPGSLCGMEGLKGGA